MNKFLQRTLLWLTLASWTPQLSSARDIVITETTDWFSCKVSDTLYTLWHSDSVAISNLKNKINDEVNKIPDCTDDDKKFFWEVIDSPDFIDFINSNGWKSPFDIFHWILWLLSAFLTYLLLKEKKSKNKINASLLSKILNMVSLSSWRDLYQVVTSLLLHFSKDDNNELHIDDNIREIFDKVPLCITLFKDGEPIIWNKKMEELSWFTHKQILEEIKKAKEKWIQSPYSYVMYYDNLNDDSAKPTEFLWDKSEWDKVNVNLWSLPKKWFYSEKAFEMLKRREIEWTLREKISLYWTTTDLWNNHSFRIWREPNIEASIEIMRPIFDFIDSPISYYVPEKLPNWEISSRPIVWNKALEKITWYSFEDIDYYYKQWTLLETLYPDEEERNRVIEFVAKLSKWESYKNELFTMTTNYKDEKWEFKKVTLLWSSTSNWFWWSFRTAKVIDEPTLAILRKKDPTRIDESTWVFNEKAQRDDMNLLFNKSENSIPSLYDNSNKILVTVNLRWIDEWFPDEKNRVLKELSELFKVRDWQDFVYRVWDQLDIVLTSSDTSTITDRMREIISTYKKRPWNSNMNLSLSLWISNFNVDKDRKNELETWFEIFSRIKDISNYYYTIPLNNFKLIESELKNRRLNVETLTEWDWIAFPLFDWGIFIWTKIILNSWNKFDLSLEEIRLIHERINKKTLS